MSEGERSQMKENLIRKDISRLTPKVRPAYVPLPLHGIQSFILLSFLSLSLSPPFCLFCFSNPKLQFYSFLNSVYHIYLSQHLIQRFQIYLLLKLPPLFSASCNFMSLSPFCFHHHSRK
jgi:hypothetical protein